MNSELLLPPEVVRLARAIRFSLVSLVVALSYFPIRVALMLPMAEQAFRDMLYGKPLPPFTNFVIHSRPLLLVCACLIPLLAIATLFSQHLVASFYLLGGLCLMVVVFCISVYQALSAPFIHIVQQMQGV